MAFMRARLMGFAITAGLLLSALPRASLAEESSLQAAIEKLNSDDYEERSKAAGLIVALGEAARPALEKALSSDDLEIHLSAGRMLAMMRKNSLRIMAFDRNGKGVGEVEATLSQIDYAERFQNRTRNSLPVTFGADGIANVSGAKTGTSSLSFAFQKCSLIGGVGFYGSTNFNTMTQLGSGITPFLFPVSRGGRVKITLRDASGKPIKNAEVRLLAGSEFNPDLLDSDNNNGMRALATGTTDAAGNTLIEGVADGVYGCVGTLNGVSKTGSTLIRVREGQTTEAPALEGVWLQNGKCEFILSGISNADLEALKTKTPANTGKQEPLKRIDVNPKSPEPLKTIKVFIAEEFVGDDVQARKRRDQLQPNRFNRFNLPAQTETDDHGKITLPNLRAGKHRILINCSAYAPKVVMVDIPSGGNVDLGEIVLDTGGALNLEALSSDGKPITDLVAIQIPEDENLNGDIPEQVFEFIRGQKTWEEARNYIYNQRQTHRFSSSGNALKLKNLAPGNCALLVCRQSSTRMKDMFLICGVAIEAGKTIVLPPLKFSSPLTPPASANSTIMKGKVIGAAGQTFAQSTIYYQSANSTTGSTLNTDGTFQIYPGGLGLGGIIRMKVPGYKLVELDCSTPGINIQNIEIKLEKLKYGDLSLRIVDEAGLPIEGAIAEPAFSINNTNYYFNYNRRTQPNRKTTDASGATRLSGLSSGLRHIHVLKEGYYLADPVRVMIQPNLEARVEVMMRKGKSISGRLEAPPGSGFENTVVTLTRTRDSLNFHTLAAADGTFSFEGLAPDKYTLAAEGPLMKQRAIQKLEMGASAIADVHIPMAKKGGCAVRLGKSMAGRFAYLQSRGATGVDQPWEEYIATTFVDDDGLADFWGVTAGTYRVSIFPDQRAAAVNSEPEKYRGRISGVCRSTPFEIANPKILSEFKMEDAVAVPLPDTSASAVVKFVIQKSHAGSVNKFAQSNVSVFLRSDHCTAQYNYWSAADDKPSAANSGKLKVIGTLPAFLAPRKPPTAMLFQSLAPGKYKISTMSWIYDSLLGTYSKAGEMALTEFEVKAGERRDLGTLVIEPKQQWASPRDGSGSADVDPPTDDDLDPAFNP